MDKTSIKNFAVWAREKLIADIVYKAGMFGISEKGVAEELPQSTNDLKFFDIGTKDYIEVSGNQIGQRNALIQAINTKENDTGNFKDAFKFIVEEVAYTWFNRLIAIRFMEVNEYLPSEVRVLSSVNSAKSEPDLVTNPFDTDLQFTAYEKDRIYQLKDENKSDELFRMLFIKQCNKLHEILPDLFEPTEDYTELLLTLSFTDKDGVIYKLTHDIDENDFNVEATGQVEIIGWMYQYYISARKDEVFAAKKTVTKDTLPAFTQLFTPDWIVRYMAENSVGRIWLESYPEAQLKNSMKYYIDDAPQKEDVQKKIDEVKYKDVNPEDMKILEPCCGSGHILVYVFDLLTKMYEERGYLRREIPTLIFKNNLFGLEIDKRATQLAYFALIMKAREYNPRFFNPKYYTRPQVYEICDSKLLLKQDIKQQLIELKLLSNDEISDIMYLIEVFKDAKTIGSLLKVKKLNYEDLTVVVDRIEKNAIINIYNTELITEGVKLLRRLICQAKILSDKYDVMITNPPYIGISTMEDPVKNYANKYYPNCKTDMFAMFMDTDFVKSCGFMAMINMHSWMFLSSYEKLRKELLTSKEMISMLHLGVRAFEAIGGEVVQTTSFVLRNMRLNGNGVYYRLVNFSSQDEKEQQFLSDNKTNNKYITDSSNFAKIPGSPIAYWVSDNFIKTFNVDKLKSIARARCGVKTGKNELFIRNWWEVSIKKIKVNCISYTDCLSSKIKWFPYNKGGLGRNWYGNRELIVDFEFGGKNIKDYSKKFNTSIDLNATDVYCKPGITWTALTSSKNTFRYSPQGSIFDSNKGPMLFYDDLSVLHYILGFLVSKVSQVYINVFNPSLSLQNGDMDNLPIIFVHKEKDLIDKIVTENIKFSKQDWDNFETSWDFKKCPLL